MAEARAHMMKKQGKDEGERACSSNERVRSPYLLFCMTCMSYYTIFFPLLFGLPAIPRHEKQRTTKTREKDTETETGEPFFFFLFDFWKRPKKTGRCAAFLESRRPPATTSTTVTLLLRLADKGD